MKVKKTSSEDNYQPTGYTVRTLKTKLVLSRLLLYTERTIVSGYGLQYHARMQKVWGFRSWKVGECGVKVFAQGAAERDFGAAQICCTTSTTMDFAFPLPRALRTGDRIVK